MNIETLGALTPYATFFLAVILGILGWLLKWMINGNQRRFAELNQQIHHVAGEIKDLERSRQADQKYLHEQFVNKEAHTLAQVNSEALFRRILDQLNDLSRSVHQIIGALNTRDHDSRE